MQLLPSLRAHEPLRVVLQLLHCRCSTRDRPLIVAWESHKSVCERPGGQDLWVDPWMSSHRRIYLQLMHQTALVAWEACKAYASGDGEVRVGARVDTPSEGWRLQSDDAADEQEHWSSACVLC